jgi:hypothetical protein
MYEIESNKKIHRKKLFHSTFFYNNRKKEVKNKLTRMIREKMMFSYKVYNSVKISVMNKKTIFLMFLML